MSYHVYIGPFLRIPFVLVETTRRVFSCKPTCTNHDKVANTAFCPLCGAPEQVKRTGEELRPFSIARLPEEFTDVLYHCGPLASAFPHETLWLPNQRGYGLSLDSHNEASMLQLPSQERMQSFAKKFEVLSAGIREYLENSHGLTTHLGMGIVSYRD